MSSTSPDLVRPVRRRWLRRLGFVLLALFVAALGAGAWFHHRLRASLPRLEGEARLAGLGSAVTIERDDLGIPTIRAATRLDAYRALGFLHGQDRFFQMDLLRRQAAGELAELFGAAAVPLDRRHRVHRFREVARKVVERAEPLERAVLAAYAEGVTAGLADLGEKPFEYVVAGVEPAPWTSEDSVLAVLAMFFELHDEDGSDEAELGELQAALPAAMFEFLTPPGTEWDAPVAGEAFSTGPIPEPEVLDLRKQEVHLEVAARLPGAGLAAAVLEPTSGGLRSSPRTPRPEDGFEAGPLLVGSNNWALSGAHTKHGGALVANDMHLGIGVPNTWYRVSIQHPEGADGQPVTITGVSLPGVPSVAVGSNGHVAWGFTNSYGDWTDRVILEPDPSAPGDAEAYRSPQGPKKIERIRETIRVKGAAPVELVVEQTLWGPIIGRDGKGRRHALVWIAHDPEAVDVSFLGLESARTIDQALAIAHRAGIPPQNFTVGDRSGRIAWTIIGKIPRRFGFTGKVPESWAEGTRGWNGFLASEEIPAIVDPPSGRIWTANARVVSGADLEKVGDGGYDLGARAHQIRDGLASLEGAQPADLLAIQLDDRALFLERWRGLLLATLTPEAIAANPDRAELKRLVESTWTGRASVDSVAYRATRGFRSFVVEQVWGGLTGQTDLPRDRRPVTPTNQFEGPLWKILSERPVHLLDPKFKTWDEALLASVDAVLAFWRQFGESSTDRTWGERNRVGPRHPMSAAIPGARRWLDVPVRSLPGDNDMPRVQGPGFGASERFVMAPGHETLSLGHMPVGQSGHPFSPHYRDGHDAWAEGRPTPFLPGPVAKTLRLVP
jgi:penicillin amidase